jgi:AcrR family transcriptional regulator
MATDDQTAAEPRHGHDTPRAAQRATRQAGRSTRTAIRSAASALFREHGLTGTSIGDIARAADVFPSQIAYYFGTKDRLFVESACHDILRAARQVERAGATAHTPAEYVRAIITTALAEPSLLTFAEAMLLAGRHPELSEPITETFTTLHREGERAARETLTRHNWTLRTTPEIEARAYWATVIGVVLQRAATGTAFQTHTTEAAVALVLNPFAAECHQQAGFGSGAGGRSTYKPSPRPMISFMISVVPPKMVWIRASR